MTLPPKVGSKMQFAFYGRVSTEDQQDPESSRQWQRSRCELLIGPHGGEIVAEYFDIGESRSLPWKRRPQANRLLDALANPERDFDAVIIGEPQRAFYGAQYGDTFPLFVHYGVGLWVPEIGGAIDPASDVHDLIMNLYGGMGKGERTRIRTRVQAAMRSQVKLEGRDRGGCPPFGYQLADAGPHPNPAKATEGKRLRHLEEHPTYAPVVQRIFAEYLSGSGIKAIAKALTDDGIPSPSGADPERNRHRSSSGGVWGQSAIRAILKNPRYTGYQVWSRQQKHEVLLDVNDVAAGHVTKQRWNPDDEWQWSTEPAHEAIISMDDWRAAQDVFASRSRTAKPKRRRKNDYMLKGMVHCSICGRKLVASVSRDTLYYQCRIRQEYPGIDHPKSISVREEHLLPVVDSYLMQLFAQDNLDSTVTSLVSAQATPSVTAEELEARRVIRDSDRAIANLQRALRLAEDDEQTGDMLRLINEEKSARKGAEIRLRRLTTGQGLTEDEIRRVVGLLKEATSILSAASPEDRRRVYEAANLGITYDHDRKAAKLSWALDNGGVGGGT